MIYDSGRHEPVTNEVWSRDKALMQAHQIFDFLCDGQQDNGLWPAHKNEDSEILFNKSIYFGAAGTVWGLNELGLLLNRKLPFDVKELSNKIYQHYIHEPDTKSVVPSYLLGESGVLQLCQKFAPSDVVNKKLLHCVESNIKNPVNEALWGCPGTMLVALRMGDIEIYKASADYLLEQWIQSPEGYWIWLQDLYGKIVKYVGAGHGFFGNVYALLEGYKYLSDTQRHQLLERTIQTTLASALRENGFANWSPQFQMDDPRPPLTQWCHGAPGVITSLKSFPKNESQELEKILVEAGETIWASGPLKKGIGICHGTDGNGFALLRLYQRTKDPIWLKRARQFAMHAMNQRNGRYTLWTGEAGLGLFLLACVNETAEFPSLDYF